MKKIYLFLMTCFISVVAWAALPVGSFTIDFRTLCADLPTSGSAVTWATIGMLRLPLS